MVAIDVRGSIIVVDVPCIIGDGLYIVVGGADEAGPGAGVGPGATVGAGPMPPPQLEQPPPMQPDVIIGWPQPP